jgi:hypothetical protein
MDAFVERFSVGAMDADAALGYFRRTADKAVMGRIRIREASKEHHAREILRERLSSRRIIQKPGLK